MLPDDVKLWFEKADNDYEAAYSLNSDFKKKTDIICYLCTQAVEKYLKGFLSSNNHNIKYEHDLVFNNNICINYDNRFKEIERDCASLNKYVNTVRYPHGIETTITDSNFCLKTMNKIEKFIPLQELRKALKIIPVSIQQAKTRKR